MIKKVIISSMAFFGMSLMALYTAQMEDRIEDEIESAKDTSFAPLVVLELFTSQGCSSCPPADELLEKVKNQYPKEVFALSYHVDYWNYIGWKDPFSKSIYTKKQSDYNRKFGYSGNYTPELVINGREHLVGSNQYKLYSKIAAYKGKRAENDIDLSNIESLGNRVSFEYKIEGSLEGKLARVVLVLNDKTTKVTRGENRNRVLRNSNIVVAEKYVESVDKNGATTINIPATVNADDNLILMVLIENDNLDITGASKASVGR
ncbi:DUF1223 domain-containing protein [Flagellimonas nanhaiensis]|uniref:DUF1223 domain-containing protein n=1 Tax=Flagellimonas nanhaiensis TaxID=2292706 RepID=A0A371JLE2_9FLAO|nr:DUF1223 domain-containing protein [Allomuricauda nanhaiensis]RDY57757.1 DUF1223 domain-containing protein [Allomuricauda nanhaiensis]